MNKIVMNAIKMSMEITLFLVVVMCIVVASNFSKEFNEKKVNEEALKYELKKVSELYSYDERDVNGDDIMLLVNRYARVLNISVQLGGSGSDVWLELSPNSSEHEWDSKYVRSQLGNSIKDTYLSTLERDINGNVVGVIFKSKMGVLGNG